MSNKIIVTVLLIVGIIIVVFIKKLIFTQILVSELSEIIEEHQESLPPIERAIARRSIEELKEALRNTEITKIKDTESSIYFEDAINKNWSKASQ